MLDGLIESNWTGWEWMLAYAAAACIGLSKTGFAGFGMLTVVIMAQILPALESTGIVLPMLIFADVFAVLVFRRHAQWNHVWQLMPPAILGIILGFLLMPVLPADYFGPLIGAIVLVMIALQALRQLRPGSLKSLPESKPFAWTMGGIAGSTTMLANAAGPVMTIYLLVKKLPKYEFVGTAAVFFMLINWIKVPFSWSLGLIQLDTLLLNVKLFPGILVGIVAGSTLIRVVPQKLFETILLLFAAAGALRLMF